jgi:hypothetical protein
MRPRVPVSHLEHGEELFPVGSVGATGVAGGGLLPRHQLHPILVVAL